MRRRHQRLENRRKDIGQPQDTDNLVIAFDQQGLLVSHNQMMDGLIQGCILAHAFICRQGMHEIAHMDIGGLFPEDPPASRQRGDGVQALNSKTCG
jgi:hypothetical protein